MAKAAAVPAKKEVKKATSTKPPKGYAGTQQEWDATSAAGKVYHIRKAEGLCVRCGKKALAGKLMCQTHTDYIKTFVSNKNGEDTPKGKTTGKKAKATPAKKTTGKSAKKTTKAYRQLGVKQLADDHMEAINEE